MIPLSSCQEKFLPDDVIATFRFIHGRTDLIASPVTVAPEHVVMAMEAGAVPDENNGPVILVPRSSEVRRFQKDARASLLPIILRESALIRNTCSLLPVTVLNGCHV